MIYIVLIQFFIIAILCYRLKSARDRYLQSTTFVEPVNDAKASHKVTYSWVLDSARKTKLKGHLVLHFDPEEIKEQRRANPFAIYPHNDVETNLRQMYFYMLSHPRTIMHVAQIVKYINRLCSRHNVGELDKLQFVLDFVQEPNVRYNYDHDCTEINHSLEYVRFPDETLFDRHGDCDCKAFLAATLFHVMGYNVLYLLSYKLAHAAVCVEYDQRWKALLQNKKEIESVTIEYNGRSYVYCETTSDHYRIGGISPEYSVQDFETKIEIRG